LLVFVFYAIDLGMHCSLCYRCAVLMCCSACAMRHAAHPPHPPLHLFRHFSRLRLFEHLQTITIRGQIPVSFETNHALFIVLLRSAPYRSPRCGSSALSASRVTNGSLSTVDGETWSQEEVKDRVVRPLVASPSLIDRIILTESRIPMADMKPGRNEIVMAGKGGERQGEKVMPSAYVAA